jgi:hypothetical protein
MPSRCLFDLSPQAIVGPHGQQRRAVVGPFAPEHHDLAALKIDVLHPHRQGLEEAEAAAIKKFTGETERRLQPVEKCEHFTARQHRWEELWPSSA